MTDLLFVYGTLHPDHAPAAIRSAARQLQMVGPATVRGTLYQFDGYPGVIMPGPSPCEVPGHIFRLPADATVLARLDAYEGFLPEDVAASLFRRVLISAELPSGDAVQCWAYLYNRTVIHLIQR